MFFVVGKGGPSSIVETLFYAFVLEMGNIILLMPLLVSFCRIWTSVGELYDCGKEEVRQCIPGKPIR